MQTGGLAGIPNIGLVHSALERPYSGYYRPITRKAAALVESMASNHGFADGNKRTTIILTHLLLSKSGYILKPLDGDHSLEVAMEELVLSVVRHQMDFNQIVGWFIERLENETSIKKRR